MGGKRVWRITSDSTFQWLLYRLFLALFVWFLIMMLLSTLNFVYYVVIFSSAAMRQRIALTNLSSTVR